MVLYSYPSMPHCGAVFDDVFWLLRFVHSIRLPRPAMWWSVPVMIVALVGLHVDQEGQISEVRLCTCKYLRTRSSRVEACIRLDLAAEAAAV